MRPARAPAESFPSEAKPYSKTQLTFVEALAAEADDARDFRKPAQAPNCAIAVQYAIRNVVPWICEMRGVAKVERFGAELQLESFLEWKFAKQTEVPVNEARTAHRIE